jgi:hypothetical protein
MIRMEGIMRALSIRKDRTPAVLRNLAKAEGNPRVTRRLLAIASALSGMSRKEAAEAAGMDRQALRDWVIRYNLHGVDGLYDCWGDGRPPRLEPQEQAGLMRLGGSRSGKRPLRLHARGLGAHLRGPLRQDLPSRLAGPGAEAARFVAAEGEAQPPAKRPGRGRGL